MLKHPIRTLLALITFFFLAVGISCESHNQAFSEKHLLRTSADKLRATVVTAHPAVPIPPNTNVLWCGTFQLAWNEATKLAGGRMRFRELEPPLAAELNQPGFAAGDLDDDSYVALAGFVRDGIYDRINSQLRDRFGGKAAPELLPDRSQAPRPQDIVVYAYLFKNLEFPVRFEQGQVPLPFEQTSVACFGMTRNDVVGREKMEAQTLILDYVDSDDFVIELKTKSPGDRMILAEIEPAATLAQTIAAVQKRVAQAKPAPADPTDVLVVPKINFDVTRSYSEIAGLHLVPTAPDMAADLQILVADQNTRFQMDEKGVKLKSEARMIIGCGVSGPQTPRHQLMFDKPFLVMLSRTDARSPYFALWVANPELLVKAEQPLRYARP